MNTRSRMHCLITALVVGAITLTGASSASAETTAPTDAISIALTDGDAAATPQDPDDPEDSASTAEVGAQCVVCGAPVVKTVRVSGPTLEQKKFVRYLTGAWAKSTGYSWSTSTTVGATLSTNLGVSAAGASSSIGVSASVTKSYSITVNIAASSGKYSKLGLASNYNRYYVKSARHQNGKLLPGATWKYGYLSSPTKDQYLVVYYQ